MSIIIGTRPPGRVDPRVDANCGSYPKCGGCSFRHIDYKKELLIKENNVKNNLKRIGTVEPEFEPIFGLSETFYRNKAQYPVSVEKGELKIGFFAITICFISCFCFILMIF
mgnify:CR=1 FL=1